MISQMLEIPFGEFEGTGALRAPFEAQNCEKMQIVHPKTCVCEKFSVPLRSQSAARLKTYGNIGEIMPKTTAINNRRYLGNKYKLLPFITNIVHDHCHDVRVVADLFAGTGAVSSAFANKQLITNDLLFSNYVSNYAWFGSQDYREQYIINQIATYNELHIVEDNYMSDNFANTFFSMEDCRKIGYIREDIEQQYRLGNMNLREYTLLITSLLYAMDKIANTCGHYDAYRKGGDFDQHLELLIPAASHNNNPENRCFNMDINKLVSNIEADLVYLDPPYNSRQYCDAYHLLENVARWQKPSVEGVARKMDRTNLKSAYCTKAATKAFEDLINNIHARYILLSYNNMQNKGNERSNAKLSDEDIIRILSQKGNVQIFTEDYKAFTTGKSDIQDNAERLFLCTCE